MTKQADGTWQRGAMLTKEQAWALIAQYKSLTINGSGNDFNSAMAAASMMGNEMNLAHSVHYYMPQVAGWDAYNSATNSAMRTALQYIYNQSNTTGTTVNVQSHSWGAYVASTVCASANCSKINEISYAPATIPTKWDALNSSYQNFAGTQKVFLPTKDYLLAGTTYLSTFRGVVGNPAKMTRVDVVANHSIKNILGAGSYASYWKN